MVVIATVGCGSTTKRGDATPTLATTTITWTHALSLPTDSCSLVTNAEAENLVGYAVVGQQQALDSAQTSCTYAPPGSTDSPLATHVVIRIFDSTRTKGNLSADEQRSIAVRCYLGRRTFARTRSLLR